MSTRSWPTSDALAETSTELREWATTFRPAAGELWCRKCGEVADRGVMRCLRCGSTDVEEAAAVLERMRHKGEVEP